MLFMTEQEAKTLANAIMNCEYHWQRRDDDDDEAEDEIHDEIEQAVERLLDALRGIQGVGSDEPDVYWDGPSLILRSPSGNLDLSEFARGCPMTGIPLDGDR